MTRRRFFASPEAFDFACERVTLTADEARHLRDVLRLKEGDEGYVFNGTGREFCCVITLIKRDLAELNIRNEVEPTRPESPLNLTLAVALLKGEKFDLVVLMITELGPCKAVPLLT